MSYQTEFPDFNPPDMPTIPEGFEDTSWRNDSAPSFTNKTLRLRLFVDFADRNQREIPESERFSVSEELDDATGDVLLATDDWAEIVAFVEARLAKPKSLPPKEALAARFVAILKGSLSSKQFAEMRRRNRDESSAGVCHSHDFCDANMLMAQAFSDLGYSTDYDFGDDEAFTARWNEAWEHAMPKLTGPEEVYFDDENIYGLASIRQSIEEDRK